MWLTHSMVLLDVCIRWLDQSRPIGTRLLRILNLGRRWVGLPGTPPASLGTWPRLVRLTARTASASVWAFQVELGFACFVSTRHFWQLFKALVMFGSTVRLLPSDPYADRLKWSGCHFLCPHPPPAPSHLLILHPLNMPFIILITTVTFPLPLPPQNQSSILWTLCPRDWLSCTALDVSVWQFDRIWKSKIVITSTSLCCTHLRLNSKDEQLSDILKQSRKKTSFGVSTYLGNFHIMHQCS